MLDRPPLDVLSPTSVTTGLLGTADVLCEAQTVGVIGHKAIRRAWSGWDAARDAIVSVFRALGPGDYSMRAGGPTRLPETTESGPDRLYTSALVSVVVGVLRNGTWDCGVPGVVSATVTTPSVDVQATPMQLIVPQEIRFTPTGA